MKKMGNINVLPRQVAELIAAGEVIERPASVIKELVENSIDAKAEHITVEIQDGGTTFMRVTDDGAGILSSDVKNAFLRHATSKVKISEDLDAISTLGFRGEALASICAVSKVEVLTHSLEEADGIRYELHGGEEVSFETVGCPQGTTFIVRELFYNVPARMKFLKKDVSEGNTISTLIDRLALSHPEISFTFIRDGRQILRTMGDGKIENVIFQVFGREFADSLIKVSYTSGGISVNGFVTKPVQSKRANRSMQIFCINGRYIRTRTGMAALEQAYSGMLMSGKYPSCILMLKMNCSMLDVNVHPAKLEVRFSNERPVFDCIYHAVRSAVAGYDSRSEASKRPEELSVPSPQLLAPPADKAVQLGFSYGGAGSIRSEKRLFGEIKDAMSFRTSKAPADKPELFIPPSDSSQSMTLNEPCSGVQDHPSAIKFTIDDLIDRSDAKENNEEDDDPVLQFRKEEKSEIPTQDEQIIMTPDEESSEDNAVLTDDSQVQPEIVEEQDREKPFRFIGEAFSTYIILEYDNDRLMFIDKHAAHERLIYERLRRRSDRGGSQLLLDPVSVTLEKDECQAIEDNSEMLFEAGFEVERFGERTVLVRSIPVMLSSDDIAEQLSEIANFLLGHRKLVITEKIDWIYANTACRAAVKAGNVSHPEELIDLAMTLERNPEIKYCPHGRPIYFFMSRHELERSFKRI